MASEILADKFPEEFAIIDIRVLKQLGKTEWFVSYKDNPIIFEEYTLIMRKLAQENNMRLKDYEQMLYERE